MAVTSTIIGVIGTGVGVSQQRKAVRAQERAERISRRQADLDNQRRIRQAVGQARQDRAQVLAAATAGGVEDSSGALGGTGAAQTQLGANVGFFQQSADANNAANRQISRANRFSNNAQTAQAIGGLGQQLGFGGAREAGAQIRRRRATGQRQGLFF